MTQAPLLAANRSRLSPLRVGPIYQEFSSTAVGRVDNIIQLSVPFLLEPGVPHKLLSIGFMDKIIIQHSSFSIIVQLHVPLFLELGAPYYVEFPKSGPD